MMRRDQPLGGNLCYVTQCPLCGAADAQQHDGVIYRRSNRSVTLRCRRCGLQWTMTWLKVHQAAKRLRELVKSDGAASDLGQLAEATAFAVSQETRGRAGR